MCRAGVPLPRALRLLARDLEHGGLRRAAQSMASDVEAGAGLAEAYARQQRHLPPLYRVLIEAGMAAGDLPGILEEIAQHAAQREQVRERMRKALFHPLISAVGVAVIGVSLLLLSGPILGPLADASAGSMVLFAKQADPTWWRLAPWALPVLLCTVVLGGLAFAWFRGPLDGGTGPRGLAFRLPFGGHLRACAARSGFASTLGLLVGRGLPLPQALTLAAAATDEPAVRRQVEEMGVEAAGGANLADSVAAGRLVSPAMHWLVATGEQHGRAAAALLDVARIYRQRLDRGVDRLCALVAPLALLATGLIVLAFVAATLGPVYGGFVRGLAF